MVFSEDLDSCIPAWKNPSRMCGYTWGLLKVREREIQKEHGGVPAERACFSFSGAFKTYINPWKGQTQEIPTQE
jgi:hypothetical protein